MQGQNNQVWDVAIRWVDEHKDVVVRIGRRYSRDTTADLLQTAYLAAYTVIAEMGVAGTSTDDFLSGFTRTYRRLIPPAWRELPAHPSTFDICAPDEPYHQAQDSEDCLPAGLLTLLQRIGGREAEVLMALTGYNSPCLTLADAGSRLGVTRQTVAKMRDEGIRQARLARFYG